MIYGLVLVVHVLVALFLIAVILLQGGRGGLGETLGGAAAQSLFGGGANIVMTKVTAIGAGLFMVTCLSLAMLSTGRGRSVIDQLPMMPESLPLPLSESPGRAPQPFTPPLGPPSPPGGQATPANATPATPPTDATP